MRLKLLDPRAPRQHHLGYFRHALETNQQTEGGTILVHMLSLAWTSEPLGGPFTWNKVWTQFV